MKKLLISVAVFAFAIASFAQAPGYEFTTVVSHKAHLSKIGRPPELAGALPLHLLWSRNCSAWGKENTIYQRCSSSAKST